MKKLIDDISVITSIPRTTLANLSSLSEDIIMHDVYEEIVSNNSVSEINIGIGILYIKHEGEEIKYRFVPSKKLESGVLSVVAHKSTPIVNKAEESLRTRVERTYKELI